MRVWYGIDRLNKIMKKPRFSVIFENEKGGDSAKREKKAKQRMDVFHVRRQTAEEQSGAYKSNRIFTIYGCFIYEKPIKGNIDLILEYNFHADEPHVSLEERLIIKDKLKKALLRAYPDLRIPKGQQTLI